MWSCLYLTELFKTVDERFVSLPVLYIGIFNLYDAITHTSLLVLPLLSLFVVGPPPTIVFSILICAPSAVFTFVAGVDCNVPGALVFSLLLLFILVSFKKKAS